MKVCEICGEEMGGKDGENLCPRCEREGNTMRQRIKRRLARQGRDQARKDCGLVKVKGALGGTYWE